MIKIKGSISIRMPSGKFPPGSFAAVLAPCRGEMQRDVQQSFAGQKDPVTGRAWPERKHFYPWPMLQRSGKLFTAAQAAAGQASINGNTITLTMVVPDYAKWHLKGTRKMAKRRFVGCSATTRAALKRRLKGAGLRLIRGERVA